MTIAILKDYTKRVGVFASAAHTILSKHESSFSRVIVLEDSYSKLDGLSLKQDDLFRQGFRCTENELYRAAHVMTWAGVMDFIEDLIRRKGVKRLGKVRPQWAIKSIDDVREKYPEVQILEAGRDLSLYSKNECKALVGMLNRRNECAHPSDYYPGLNETVGYISEALSRVASLKRAKKKPK